VPDLDRLAGDLDEIVKRVSREGTSEALVRPSAALEQEMAVAPRDAFLGAAERVPVAEAVGRVSCESIAGYPPGIPALLPGERITAEVIDYLRELTGAGARLHGASDPSFETLTVLAHEETRRP
jgi:arginine decarboxylase